MTTTTTAEPVKKVTCTECRHENEAERIYCHNCGERLDRSGVASQKKSAGSEESRRRLEKMMGPPNQLRRNFFATSKLVLAAAGVAALVQIALPPDLPAPTKAAPQQIDLDLENLASLQKPGPLTFSQDQVNAYLNYRLAGKKKALNKPLLTFERAVTSFREGEGTIALERSFFGYSLFSCTSYRVETKDGKVFATNTGASIGRLPVHPALMKYGNVVFADLWSALDREGKLLAKMSAITFQDGTVTISGPAR